MMKTVKQFQIQNYSHDGEEANLTQGDTLLKIIPASGDAAGSTVTVSQI